MKKTLLYISGILTLLWGIAHLFPTSGIVRDFGNISSDNMLIITMEWIAEGLTMIFLGVLVIIVTRTDCESKLAKNIYILTVVMLFSMAVLSLFTGFGVDFLPFKICPIIFSISAIFIIIGMNSRVVSSK
ncbi:hypothetical protein ACFLQX_00135 [Bacteroidota bacterium]